MRILIRIILAVLLVALLAGAAVWIYNAGLANGAAMSGKLVAPNTGPMTGVAPYYGFYPPFFHPWGFFFFPFGLIGLLFGIFIISAIIRGLFFWGRGGRGWGMHSGMLGRWSGDPSQVPPMVEEWHKRMHGQPADQSQDPPKSG